MFRTAGGGGWGDPLEREPERVRADVQRRLMSAETAARHYGVVLAGEEQEVDFAATEARRESVRRSRGQLLTYDFGERPWEAAGLDLAAE